MERISKTDFKAHALKLFRDIEQSGKSRIITDHGKPTLEVRKLRQQKASSLEILKDTVITYQQPTDPVGDDDWENA